MATTVAKTKFGRYLKLMRVEAGLTQQDIADSLEYNTAQFISNWERGVSLPPADALKVLAKLFGVSHAALIKEVFRCRRQEIDAEQAAALSKVAR